MNCQRWLFRRESYRPAGETINPDRYRVEPLERNPAKEFVESHHYSGSYPADRFRAGLFCGGRLVGAAIFSVPVNNNSIPFWTGCKPEHGAELGRFVLLDSEPSNAETWFLSRAFRLLRDCKPEIRGIIAYSDPLERYNESTGELVKPGHVGTIYQAHNGAYVGRSSAETLILAPSGVVINRRTLGKIRGNECGKEYAIEQLIRHGCPAPWSDESGVDYVTRATAGLRRVRHPGNFVYAWPTHLEKKAYPKKGQAA